MSDATHAHPMRRMRGRDPHEHGRASTPLELLFDLTFVVAVGIAAGLFAHSVAAGHTGPGLLAFTFSVFAVTWAWINFSWFASAFDTDDWVFRVVTMVQMVGVSIVALGLPNLFHSFDEGQHVDNRVLVIGYVVMRLAMVFNWLRAARQAPQYRPSCLAYAKAIAVAQAGWVVVAILDLPLLPTLACFLVLYAVEFTGPYLAERRFQDGTPWNPHHIAERYSLFAIIALGEGVVGTVAALGSVQDSSGGLTADVFLLGAAGIGLTVGMWWTYFVVPSAECLEAHPERGFRWGYGNMVVFGAIIATGAGLHVAALAIDGEAKISPVATVLSVAVPVALYVVAVLVLYSMLMGSVDRFHGWLVLGTVAVLAASVGLAAAGVSVPLCLLVTALATAVPVVGFETVGHRHAVVALQRVTAR